MSQELVCRAGELGALADFLTSASLGPAGLTIEGEAGIGKTTLWNAATEQARERGYRVLLAQAGQAESAMSYAAVADLLSDVESSHLLRLPELQRTAVDRVLLRSGDDGPETDQRIVAAAFLAVIEMFAADAPVLLAIDDVHWLDASSRAVVVFAARRLKGRVGVLVTERLEPTCPSARTWLRVGTRNVIGRIPLGPLSLSGLYTVVAGRLGSTPPRPLMVRIAELSEGNPFFALELAREVQDHGPSAVRELPRTLVDVVRSRIGEIDDEVRNVLLAAACVTDPTVDLLAGATGLTAIETVELLETAESRGLVGIEGNRVRFAHPLLARGLYTEARPSRRRKMHRALAEVEALPEVKARHLALGTTSEDPKTLEALDAAAESARARGASAAAAELIDLAIDLGGDTPPRRIDSSRYHFHAGNYGHARALLEPLIAVLAPGPVRATAVGLLAEICLYHNSFEQAAGMLQDSLQDADSDLALLAETLILLSFARLNTAEYDRSFHNASQAVKLTDELDLPALSSRACAMWTMVNFVCGQGVDEQRLDRALELEDCDVDAPGPLDASTVNALVLAWTGRLDDAREYVSAVRSRCIERGEDGHAMFIDLHSALIDVWRGDFAAAATTATDATERAEQLGGDHALVIADTIGAVVAAYTGREREARAQARAAIERANRCGSPRLADQAIASLGFLELSLGNSADALTTLQPLVARFGTLPGMEIVSATFLPDAIEAMIARGQIEDAEPMIEALEHHGRRLDRAWMLAMAARCRSMMLVGQGDVPAATRMAHRAMAEHDRLHMPFERARTQLLLGQLQRRQRQRDSATAILTEALVAFDGMEATLWADRARTELARIGVSGPQTTLLTPSEARVAELAAAGMTNRDIGAEVFISPKTVEAKLARIYRKLDIHTRAELGREIGRQRQRTSR
ncbi:helix-turn-helix transcriptional regulator [Mycolicibacterium arenosum]|uniref:AAA family ATPase n=1 Tax=Mycolicibacterium arenosum TaxID=2952157 RepID=A0ABT1M9S9_9MYCO|nr:LuxR family transcriptional regulator [Mycolicibacterium sp. CAU 1645]MCP9275310.1 AAA family ATPase [Mycolicibacterium sp. CAU 1645]